MQTLICSAIPCQPPSFDPYKYIHMLQLGIFKFAVFIDLKQDMKDNCSGTILHERWVLTAARCVHDDKGVLVKNLAEVRLMAGILDYNKPGIPTFQERTSEQIIIHEDYKLDTLSKYDLALIKVNKPFEFSAAVDKAVLGVDMWPDQGARSRNCFSWGFGHVGPGKLNSKLKVWNTVARHGPGACPCTNKFQIKRLICSSEALGVNLCRGDLGSSLICYEGESPLEELWEKHRERKTDPIPYEAKDSFEVPHGLNLNASQMKVYGVAHMTIDRYKCEISRVPKRECLSLPTTAAYMFLCPFNQWLRKHIPSLPETETTCGQSRMSARTALLVSSTSLFFVLSNLTLL